MIFRLLGGAESEFECVFPRGEWSDKRNIKTEVVKGHSVVVIDSQCWWLVVLSQSQWGHTVVLLGENNVN